MNNNVGVNQACASCKHQRKRCDENCEMAPYFPCNRLKEFRNAHRLFGVSNIQKIIASVEPHLRKDAAESILDEGNYRKFDPINGSLGVVHDLKSRIQFHEKQLNFVNQYLSIFKEREKLEKEKQQLDQFCSSLIIGTPNQSDTAMDDNMGGVENSEHGHEYQSKMGETVTMNSLDIHVMDQVIEYSFQHGGVLGGSAEFGDSSCVSKARGKKPMEY